MCIFYISFGFFFEFSISGPNTWQEWSREGRRSFPMLPRVAPQTALALIANSVAAEVAAENTKLPYPSDTAALVASEQAAHAEAKRAYDGEKMSWNIVSSDPVSIYFRCRVTATNCLIYLLSYMHRNFIKNHSV